MTYDPTDEIVKLSAMLGKRHLPEVVRQSLQDRLALLRRKLADADRKNH